MGLYDSTNQTTSNGSSLGTGVGNIVDPLRQPTANMLGTDTSTPQGQVGSVLNQLSVGNLMGTLFGGAQNNFQATGAPIQSGTNQDQINSAYDASQTGQRWLGQLTDKLNTQNGLGNQTNLLNQQQALANQLQMQAMGQGPNPAQAQLAQAMQANTANQAALMAGQRGIGQNAGLIARQAAMQGGANQQQAAGQAATMGAQQQLAAQQQLGQQQQAMQNVAGQQAGNYANAINSYNQSAQNQQQMLLNANAQANNATVGMQSNMNNVNGQISMANQSANKGLLGGIMSGIGSVASFLNQGGMVGYANGGMVDGPQSGLGQMLAQNMQQSGQLAWNQPDTGQMPSMPQTSSEDYSKSLKEGKDFGNNIQKGYSDYKSGNLFSNFNKGAMVPGKAKASGDTQKNDTVPAMLSPGEIVIPRSIVNSPDAAKKAAAFVQAVLAKNGKAS